MKQDVKQDKAGTQLKDKEIKRTELNPVHAVDVIKSIKKAQQEFAGTSEGRMMWEYLGL